MSVSLHNIQEPEQICFELSENRKPNECEPLVAKPFQSDGAKGSKKEISEVTTVPKIKEGQETSPFKQAVKGFGNKLSKKVATSHLLLGITERIVKKLEDSNKESCNTTEISDPFSDIRIKSPSLYNISDTSLPCDLTSVILNNVPESSNVEEAVECLEDTKSSASDDIFNRNVKEKPHVFRSLPSTPDKHCKRDISAESFFNTTTISNTDSTSNTSLQNIDLDIPSLNNNELNLSEQPVRLSQNKIDLKNTKSIEANRFSHWLNSVRALFAPLPTVYIILLLSVVIHNFEVFNWYGVSFIFDSFIVCYVSYILLCILLKTPIQTKVIYPVYSSTRYERTSILYDDSSKTIKGSVKVLKGKYEPEQKEYNTDLVHIMLENNLLKLFHQEDVNSIQPFAVYNLCGAQIHLLPKGLRRKRIFNRRYPICIAFPKPPDTTLDKSDYVSTVYFSDSLLEMSKFKAIHLFAISDREKESWYWALSHATHESEDTSLAVFDPSFKRDLSNLSYSALLEANDDDTLSISEDSMGQITDIRMSPTIEKRGLRFHNYMNFLLENFEKAASNKDPLRMPKEKCTFPVDWLNVMIGRLSYDFLTQKMWSDYVISEVQRKLDKIEMPNFVDSLKVTDVLMGFNVPQVHSISQPMNDDFGLWFDLNFTYKGSFQLTLKTNLKVPKGRPFGDNEESESVDSKQNADGTDSSDDESSSSKSQSSPSPSQNRFINKIERLINYKHFQTVAQSGFVKKYVGDIYNMDLMLTVTVNSLEGVLSLNVPPAPSDRIWFGFRKDPQLSLSVHPKVGTRQINVTVLVQLIKRKLIEAFKKAIVLPNMEDLVVPIMFAPIETADSTCS